MDLMDRILFAVIGICVAALIFLMGWLVFIGVDSVGVQTERAAATVVDKTFTPAHTTTTFVMSGKVMVPITTYYPDSWSIKVSPDGTNAVGCPASHAEYDATQQGANIVVYLKQGRLSGGLYCDGLA